MTNRKVEMTDYTIDNVTCTAVSSKAILVECADCEEFEDSSDGEGKCWIPRSQIMSESEVRDLGDTGTLSVSSWLAEKKGW
jgi:hypothetical protein